MLHHSGEGSNIKVPENAIVGSLGKGIGGDVQGYVGMIDSFKLTNDLVFQKPLSYFQQFDLEYNQDHIFRNAIIGNTLLERFHIVIDYINQVLYLKPNKNFKKAFKYDRSGLSIIASGKNLNTYIVSSVIKGSPADNAGILPGDEIRIYEGSFFTDKNSFSVEGAVRSPGRFDLDLSGQLRISDAIFMSGGIKEEALDFAYIFRRNDESSKSIDLLPKRQT